MHKIRTSSIFFWQFFVLMVLLTHAIPPHAYSEPLQQVEAAAKNLTTEWSVMLDSQENRVALRLVDPDLSHLSILTGLPIRSLIIQGSEVRELKSLSIIPSLEYLWLADTSITNCEFVSGLNLKGIDLPFVPSRKDRELLGGMRGLKWIGVRGRSPRRATDFLHTSNNAGQHGDIAFVLTRPISKGDIFINHAVLGKSLSSIVSPSQIEQIIVGTRMCSNNTVSNYLHEIAGFDRSLVTFENGVSFRAKIEVDVRFTVLMKNGFAFELMMGEDYFKMQTARGVAYVNRKHRPPQRNPRAVPFAVNASFFNSAKDVVFVKEGGTLAEVVGNGALVREVIVTSTMPSWIDEGGLLRLATGLIDGSLFVPVKASEKSMPSLFAYIVLGGGKIVKLELSPSEGRISSGDRAVYFRLSGAVSRKAGSEYQKKVNRKK